MEETRFKSLLIAAAFFAGISALAAETEAPSLTLLEALRRADEHSPQLRSARLRGLAAESLTGTARAGYFPTLEAAAVATSGQPGGNTVLQVNGDMSSTFRVGQGAAVIL